MRAASMPGSTREPAGVLRQAATRIPDFGYDARTLDAGDTLTAIKMMSVSLAANLDEEALRLGFFRMGFSEAEMLDLLPYVDADNASARCRTCGAAGARQRRDR
jgi:hypothetical protein